MSSIEVSPVVTKDPRYIAGRNLVTRGLANDGAVDIFATLLEETTTKYGESSIESAPSYYEYGNALLRAYLKEKQQIQEEEEPSNESSHRAAAAAAAEKRLQSKEGNKSDDDGDKKPAAKREDLGEDGEKQEIRTTNVGDGEPDGEAIDGGDDDNAADDDENDDLNLALEMMENAFSILEDYSDGNINNDNGGTTNQNDDSKKYPQWIKQQIPRVLLGTGDLLSAMNRHADAADAYSRALELRQSMLQEYSKSDYSISHLQAHRKVCEATVLIAEELLACPPDQDVITTETQSLIVKAEERISYAKGYYDKARDALQEAVFFMGNLAARSIDLGQEKEDVCFLATMVMGVGETLAALDEERIEASANITEPVKKKAKR